MTTEKLSKYLKSNFTNDEMMRIFDLTNRRVIDYGEEHYSEIEQKMFKKIRDTWKVFGKGNLS